MTRFLLIRHATTDSVGKRLSGRTPGVSLNEEGRTQAQYLAQRLASLPVNALYSSPLERAMQTAEPISKALGLETIICEEVLEMDFGQWTNCSFKELENDPVFQRFNTFRSNTRIPGGELMLDAQARIVRGLEKLGAQHPNQTVAVVSHADLIKAAVAYYAGIHLDMFQRLEISAASVSVLELYDETARLLLLNHTGEIKI
ncbi:histidine phosphatase family protein [Hymenobacter cavernae]|uniref:Phosphoglycerate mutase n=1 Tax=Hymenobacter cavernae TaxID=2044852 RepID=A0ABQ1TVI4_9BACT|nr:histidine phosphatase family protein [Hymenobacter cavernae]GGF02687.1 phosphoglycerate mutase [Hymenobacter cavernae]